MHKHVTIPIGGYHGSAEPTIIQTLVGSCVAVCLFDPICKIGGMNHIFLPGRADLKHYDAQARFGINAMELLINRMLALGADRRRLLSKAFGGAHVLPGISLENHAGQKISDFVLDFLDNEGIPLEGCDLGGDQGRQIRFHTDTGDAFIKRIQAVKFRNIWTEEQQALIHLRRKIKKPGAITLFTPPRG